jgi:hypothetical protein
LTRILNLNPFLSSDLAVVSIEVEITMLFLEYLLSPCFSSTSLNTSTLLILQPNRKDPEENTQFKNNAQ